jgi:hypothetical protein
MRGPITVTLMATTTTDDGLGNTTDETTSTDYPGVRYAPRSSAERTDARTPAVLSGATLYARGDFPVHAADSIVIADQHPLIDGTWQVDGDAGYWGVGVEAAIKRTP